LKKIISVAIALTFLASTAAVAQRDTANVRAPYPELLRSNDDVEDNYRPGDSESGQRGWLRGERLPDQYRQNRYFVNDWRQRNLRSPPRGYRWVRNNDNQFLLAAMSTGMIAEIVMQDQYQANRRWLRGQRLPAEYYRSNRYLVSDWRDRELRLPARGYRWYRVNDQYVLAATTNGRISDIMPNRR
jgi:Ni/Co efflux regulator RcnB